MYQKKTYLTPLFMHIHTKPSPDPISIHHQNVNDDGVYPFVLKHPASNPTICNGMVIINHRHTPAQRPKMDIVPCFSYTLTLVPEIDCAPPTDLCLIPFDFLCVGMIRVFDVYKTLYIADKQCIIPAVAHPLYPAVYRAMIIHFPSGLDPGAVAFFCITEEDC